MRTVRSYFYASFRNFFDSRDKLSSSQTQVVHRRGMYPTKLAFMFKTRNYQPINVLKSQSCNFHFIGYFTEYNIFDSCYCKSHFHAKGTLTRYAQTAVCWLESKFWHMRIIHDSSTLIARFFHVRVHKRKKFSKPVHNKSCKQLSFQSISYFMKKNLKDIKSSYVRLGT